MLNKGYSYWFLLPVGIVYTLIFVVPTLSSFFFSMTWWNLTEWAFIGFENFITFFALRSTSIAIVNTLIYAVSTSGLKVVLGLLLASFLCSGLRTAPFLRSMVFFPTLLSTMAVGISFSSLMHPTRGLINSFLEFFGIQGPDWLGDVNLALGSVVFVDVWRGVGLATVIFIAGIMSIDRQYYEAADIDGGGRVSKFLHITVPLSRPAVNTVIILSLIGGLRTFDLVWVMTGGGPGFTTDLMASSIYKVYNQGLFGLATAGNVLMFFMVGIIAYPLFKWLNRKETEL